MLMLIASIGVDLQVVREASPKAKWNFLQKYWHKGAYFQVRA